MFRTMMRRSAPMLVLAALASPAAAHVTLETQQAPADSYYKAVMRTPHGCQGAPTVRLRIRIPEGVTGVKPQPKPGWTLEIVTAKLAQPLDDGHGGKITEGIAEVVWSGGRLLDAHYDEFVMRTKLPDRPGTVLYWPVVQECEGGTSRWIEIPEPGKTAGDLREPAPGLRLTAKP
jgi:uncharacterized protein YcnI